MSDFDVLVSQIDGGVCRVGLYGELDVATAPILRERLADAYGNVIIDCSALTFLDSSGVAELIMLARRATVIVTKPSNIVRRVVETLGLTEVLGVTDDDTRPGASSM